MGVDAGVNVRVRGGTATVLARPAELVVEFCQEKNSLFLLQSHSFLNLLELRVSFQGFPYWGPTEKEKLAAALRIGFLEPFVELLTLAEPGLGAHHLQRRQVAALGGIL